MTQVASTQLILELPAYPDPDGQYMFDGLPRVAVTESNHGLHKYPAKFIPQIARWALTYQYGHPARKTVLDPFCGSGTTLVEAGRLGYRAIGVDVSPLATLITQAKVARVDLGERQVDTLITDILKRARELKLGYYQRLARSVGKECSGLHVTWSTWFQPEEMARLLAIRQAINERTGSSRLSFRTFLLACLSSVMKASLSLIRSRGRFSYAT